MKKYFVNVAVDCTLSLLLLRSTKSFRRQGSSGTTWNENLAEEINKFIESEGKLGGLRHCHSIGGGGITAACGESIAAPVMYSRNLSAPSSSHDPPLYKSDQIDGFSKLFRRPPKST